MTDLSLTDQLAIFFQLQPDTWVDGKALAQVAGGYAWRTRVSELRTEHGLTIENRQRTVKPLTGKPYKVSEYRYVSERIPMTHPLLQQRLEAKCLGCFTTWKAVDKAEGFPERYCPTCRRHGKDKPAPAPTFDHAAERAAGIANLDRLLGGQ